MYFNGGDKLSEEFAKNILKVMGELEKRLIDVVAGSQTSRDVFEAATILNSRPEMLAALRDAGYYDLASQYVAQYPEITKEIKDFIEKAGLPRPVFTDVDRETFRQLAGADFQQFAFIGESAMDELRFGLHRQAITGEPFSNMVRSIREATVGIDGKGSPLSNHAYTHANTSVLNFGGETIIAAGEAIGAEKWEVVGPDDAVTRDVCSQALDNPIRTMEEWIAADYWGGTPGGWNCRHQLFPVIDDS